MSGVFVLPQSKSVHMICDAVDYDLNGVVQRVNLAKVQTVATLPVAIAATGPGILGPLLADRIAGEFDSFDDLIERGSAWIAAEFDSIADRHFGGDASSTIYLAGWHHEANRPAAYSVNLWSDGSSRIQQVLASSRNGADAARTRSILVEAKSINGTPLPRADVIESSCFVLRRDDEYVPEVDLLHLLELARQQQHDGAHWIGGKALLTSIDATGVRQRVIHHWQEDKPGQKISPEPIADWQAWRAARAANNTISTVDSSNMSRLKRAMMERKARKAKR